MKKIIFLILAVSGMKAMYQQQLQLSPYELRQLCGALELQKQEILTRMLVAQ